MERFDPSKSTLGDGSFSNKWGLLQDLIVRYFGSKYERFGYIGKT